MKIQPPQWKVRKVGVGWAIWRLEFSIIVNGGINRKGISGLFAYTKARGLSPNWLIFDIKLGIGWASSQMALCITNKIILLQKLTNFNQNILICIMLGVTCRNQTLLSECENMPKIIASDTKYYIWKFTREKIFVNNERYASIILWENNRTVSTLALCCILISNKWWPFCILFSILFESSYPSFLTLMIGHRDWDNGLLAITSKRNLTLPCLENMW